MSKLNELVARLGKIEFGEEEDAELAARAEEAVEEQVEVVEKAKKAKSDADESETRAAEAEARASDAETRAEEAEARAEQVEQEAESAVARVVSLLEEVRSDLTEIKKQAKSLEEWRDTVVERHGLVSSSGEEASNRAGRASADEPLVPEEQFEAARKDAQGGPMRLFRNIMDAYRRECGDLYDRPGASERTTDRTLGHIRALQATRRPEDRPRFVDPY